MTYNEKDFYKKLITLINDDLAKSGLRPINLANSTYIISRTQYYNIKKLSEGDLDISRLSHSRIKEILNYFNMNLTDILFDIEPMSD